mgnify:CR=1 FL=1
MKVYYSEHLKNRINLRDVPYKAPRRIALTSTEHYFDTATSYTIAGGKMNLDDSPRLAFVAYDIIGQERIKLITVQFITRTEILARVKSKRWIKKEESS